MDKLKQAFSYTKASQQKEKSKEKQKEARRKTEDSSCSLLSHFWSTSRSPFSTFYIPFQSSGSQESNASNRVRFGAEMRKIWPSEDNCSRLVRNSHTPSAVRMVCETRTPPQLCERCAKLAHHSHTPLRGANFPLFLPTPHDIFSFGYFCINFHSSPCNPPIIRFIS